jgi:hypothetical protein
MVRAPSIRPRHSDLNWVDHVPPELLEVFKSFDFS